MIKLLTLVHKAPGISPGQRYRLEQWAPYLRLDHGIDLDFLPFESPSLTRILYAPGKRVRKAVLILRDTLRRREVLSKARDYDGVVVYREAAVFGPAVYERLLRRAGIPLFYDFDDAIWIPLAETVNGVFSRLKFVAKTSAICRLATAVTVGNRYLADFARRHNAHVSLVATSIDLSRYAVVPPPPDDGPFVIGWSGSHTTLPHLELVRPAIERLGRRLGERLPTPRRVVMNVICSRPPARPFEHVDNVFVRWRDESEAEDVGAAHVGIMPLPDDEFARGKCGCKALQYMAASRPVVISPVGMNTEIVSPGVNGTFATTADEWVEALEALADFPAERDRLGCAGRRTVEERYSATISAAHFAAAVKRGLASCATDKRARR